ncbi:hypothetical protein SBW85_03290 [Vibrio plantisponsor]|uniref:Virion structural protein n=1 Tax=Vibrio plantisponsor TaxID=664643 RepID=A0ABU4IER8_9VIBR|nr:hypothetical protein [Vibrio plantisponsor]MDW6016793.1 hypothetical protein [Vibrio plantisponsor]NNM39836.1 hypothetical protein [Vibrio plantisponsor]
MEAKQMYHLAIWYKTNVLSNNITGQLSNFKQSITQQMASTSNAASKLNQVRNESNKYKEVLGRVDSKSLSFEDINVLEKLGLQYIILRPAIPELNRILGVGDLQEISARIGDALQTIQTVDTYFRHFLEAFEKIFGSPEELDSFDTKGKVLTRIRFHNDASISNVVDLVDWSERWNTIARGYSMVLGKAPEEFEIVSASKGSIIFDLLLNLETVNMLGETFNHIATFVLTCAEIRRTLKSMDHLESNPELKKQVEAHLNTELEKKTDELAEKVANILLEKFAQEGKTDNGDVKVKLKKSVKELDNFIGKGGDVEFKAETNDLDVNEQVKLVNDAMKQLQNRSQQKQLEDKTQN